MIDATPKTTVLSSVLLAGEDIELLKSLLAYRTQLPLVYEAGINGKVTFIKSLRAVNRKELLDIRQFIDGAERALQLATLRTVTQPEKAAAAALKYVHSSILRDYQARTDELHAQANG